MKGIDPTIRDQTAPEIQQQILSLVGENQRLRETVQALEQRIVELEDWLNLTPSNSS